MVRSENTHTSQRQNIFSSMSVQLNCMCSLQLCKIYFIFKYMYVFLHKWVQVPIQATDFKITGIELKLVMSCLMWVLENEFSLIVYH